MFLNRLKLRYQIAILIGFSIAMMMVVQIVYFMQFNSLTKERAKHFASNTMDQVEDKMLSTDTQIKKASEMISFNENVQRYLMERELDKKHEYRKIVSDIFEYAKTLNDSIADIWLVSEEGEEFHSYTSNIDYLVSKGLKKQYDYSRSDFMGWVYTSSVRDSVTGNSYYAYISPVHSIQTDSRRFERIGTCIVICRTDVFQNMVQSISVTDNSLFLTLDKEQQIIAANAERLTGGVFEENTLSWNEGENKRVEHYSDGSGYIVQRRKLSDPEWEIVSIIPISELTSDLRFIRSFNVATSAFMICILIIIGIILARNLSNPIVKIIKFLETIGNKETKDRLNSIEPNEIGKLAEGINHMLDRIDEMTEEVVRTHTNLYQLELVKNQARLSALQSQINPHFLYNTLECMRSIAYAHGCTENVNIAVALAKIFRYSIKEADLVCIKEEIACIEQYLNIITIRYGGRFTASLEIKENLMQKKTMKMLLQPLVENAIYHGLERKKGSGKVTIVGKMEDGQISFHVMDNGKGMTQEELEKVKTCLSTQGNQALLESEEKRYIGLVNINDRLKLVFGSRYGINIFSREGEGTIVEVNMPLIEEHVKIL